MSLTIKHLNGDASFLLTFRPIVPFPPQNEDESAKTFTILLDPWLCGRSDIMHKILSSARHKQTPCVSSINELPELDVVIVSQSKSDHCHQETLTQLPSHSGKTLILAEPAAAKTIKGWKHFSKDKIVSLPVWQTPRAGKQEKIHRISLPPLGPGGEAGEITIAYMAEKVDLTSLHNAIGITYKAPTHSHALFNDPELLTPPDTPMSSVFQESATNREHHPLSVIFSPHGCSYSTISSYRNSLEASSALPLTAFLHCFDQIRNAWYLGGQICNGFPGGLEIALKLLPQVWISAHDGDKEVAGIFTKKLATTKFEREEVERVVSPRMDSFPQTIGTRAVVLEVGEEMLLSRCMVLGLSDEKCSASSAIDRVLKCELGFLADNR